jgi:hypothetical protein
VPGCEARNTPGSFGTHVEEAPVADLGG